jgi:DNA helicase HerA-like ATPase
MTEARPRFYWPGPQDRLAIIGRTGSGKTHLACCVLSQANWPSRPWVIIDYKRDELLAALPRIEEIGITPPKIGRWLPRQPGLYVVHPPPDSDEKVEALLMRLWARGHSGLYVDEGHMLPDSGGLKAILTQGRSKHLQTIILTQRPKWVNRFVFSEASAFSIFHLNDKRDRQTVQEVAPVDLSQPLEPRHSYYYRVEDNALFRMNPVPGRDDILQIFDDRQPARQKRRMI